MKIRSLIVDLQRPVKIPRWPGIVCFRLVHTAVGGPEMATYHNAVFCCSLLFVNGVPQTVWWVKNPFADRIAVSDQGQTTEIHYRFFPTIRVTLSRDGTPVSVHTYPAQTRKLYLVGAALLMIGIRGLLLL